MDADFAGAGHLGFSPARAWTSPLMLRVVSDCRYLGRMEGVALSKNKRDSDGVSGELVCHGWRRTYYLFRIRLIYL